MANAYRDENSIPTLIASSNVNGYTPVRLYADPITHRLLVDLPGASSLTWYKETPSGAINGSNVTYTLTNSPSTMSASLVLNGQVLTETTDYSISGTTLTMVTAIGSEFSSLPFIIQYQYA